MRSALFITAAAILLIAFLWLDDPIDAPEQQDQARSTAPTPTPAAPKAPRPFQPYFAPPPPSDLLPSPNDPAPRGSEFGAPVPVPVPRAPTATAPQRQAAAPRLLDFPRWPEFALNPTLAGARPIQIVVAGSQTEAAIDWDDTDWQRGTLTLQGSYSYPPPHDPAPIPTRRVTIAATINCQSARGVLYFRDLEQRVEWLSSAFPFADAKTYCAVEQEQLDELATRFNADLTGTYTPLISPVIGDGLDSIQLQGGLFQLRLTTDETINMTQNAVKICLLLRGGTYGYYVLPQNARNPSAMPYCTFLHSFTLQRNL